MSSQRGLASRLARREGDTETGAGCRRFLRLDSNSQPTAFNCGRAGQAVHRFLATRSPGHPPRFIQDGSAFGERMQRRRNHKHLPANLWNHHHRAPLTDIAITDLLALRQDSGSTCRTALRRLRRIIQWSEGRSARTLHKYFRIISQTRVPVLRSLGSSMLKNIIMQLPSRACASWMTVSISIWGILKPLTSPMQMYQIFLHTWRPSYLKAWHMLVNSGVIIFAKRSPGNPLF